MSIYVYRIDSPALANGTPASDLDGEEWAFECTERAQADYRAERRLIDTFDLATRERQVVTSVCFVAEYPSLTAMRRAREAA